MTLCKGCGVREAVDVGADKAAEFGLFEEKMAGVHFFRGLPLTALTNCKGSAEKRKHSGQQC